MGGNNQHKPGLSWENMDVKSVTLLPLRSVRFPDLLKQRSHLEKGNWVAPRISGKIREPVWVHGQDQKLPHNQNG